MTDGGRPGHDDSVRIEFEKFYREHNRALRHYVYKRWPQSDWESIFSETLEQVWRNWKNISGEKIAWAKTTARNLAIDAWRKQHELPVEPSEMNARLVAAGLASGTDHAKVLQDVEALPPRFRVAMSMRIWGYTNEDIARVMGCKVSSVSSYIADARKLMAKQFGGQSSRRRTKTRNRGSSRAGSQDGDQDHGAGSTATGRLPRNHHDDEEN